MNPIKYLIHTQNWHRYSKWDDNFKLPVLKITRRHQTCIKIVEIFYSFTQLSTPGYIAKFNQLKAESETKWD